MTSRPTNLKATIVQKLVIDALNPETSGTDPQLIPPCLGLLSGIAILQIVFDITTWWLHVSFVISLAICGYIFGRMIEESLSNLTSVGKAHPVSPRYARDLFARCLFSFMFFGTAAIYANLQWRFTADWFHLFVSFIFILSGLLGLVIIVMFEWKMKQQQVDQIARMNPNKEANTTQSNIHLQK